jgi:hypothetical protein
MLLRYVIVHHGVLLIDIAMNQSVLPSTSPVQNNQLICPSFSSHKVESYFFREVVANLDLDNVPSNNQYHFKIIKDPNASKEQLILLEELAKGGGYLSFDILKEDEIKLKGYPMFLLVSEKHSLNGQSGYYEFILNWGVIPYLRILKALGYCSIDWQVMESLRQKYSRQFYKFLKIAHLSGIREFSFDWNTTQGHFGISYYHYRKWKKNQNDFLENLHQEITQHPTDPIQFDYSTHQSFDKKLEEDRNARCLYFRIRD